MRLISLIALSALASASAALADTTPAAPDGTQAQPTAAKDKVTCKTIGETGSLTRSKRICMTAREWEDQREQQRNAIDKPRIYHPMGT